MSEESVFASIAAATLRAAVEAVSQGLSVHVTGPPGSGRSELLRLAARRLTDDGRDVLRLQASPAWSGEPYAALAAAGIGPANAPGPRRSAGEMSAALDRRLGTIRTIVAADDADELDGPSAGVLLSARARHDLVALTTARPRQPLGPASGSPGSPGADGSPGTDSADGAGRGPGPGAALALGFLPAIGLRPPVLGLDQAHAVSRDILGGPVDPSALARITMKSGGLYGLVRAIVTAGRLSGVLRERDGIWAMPDGGPWCDELGPAVRPFLAGAAAGDWHGATVLAVAGPLPAEDARKLVGPATLGRLFALGIAHEAAGRQTGVYPPLLADYLRREGPPLARARCAGSAPGDGGAGDGGGAGAARGAGADAAVLNQQAVRDAAGDVGRLTGDWEASPAPGTAMPLLIAMRAAGVPAGRIERVVAATPPDGSFASARLHSWYATWQAADRGDLPRALETLDTITERAPAHAGFFDVTRAHVILLRDRVPDISHLTPDPEAELQVVLRAEILLATGKTAQAQRLLDGFRPKGRVAGGQARLLTALASVLAGDLEAGSDLAASGLPGARGLGDPGLVQAHAYTAGLALGIAGRLTEASDRLFAALSSATVASYRDPYHAGVLVLAGVIALVRGRPDHARALDAQASAADAGGHGPYPSMDYRALSALLGRDGAGGLWALVRNRLSRGYLASAVFLAVEAAEREPAGTDDPGLSGGGINGIDGDGLEGRLLPALAGYAAAALAGDEAGVARAADRLASAGAVLYAARAEVTRCLLLRRSGLAEEAAGAAERSWHRSGLAPADRTALFARVRADAALSGREREILALAAGRRTTAEIAAALTMSPRTVETHLHNISRKAGVHGRDQLIRAGTTWLREPLP